MPRGGARKNAGRKAGSPNKPKVKLEPASPPTETPLEYLQRMMRDPKIEPSRRDWAAKEAGALHAKLAGKAAASTEKPGKKAAAQAAAECAEDGTDWDSLLKH